VTTTFWSDLAV